MYNVENLEVISRLESRYILALREVEEGLPPTSHFLRRARKAVAAIGGTVVGVSYDYVWADCGCACGQDCRYYQKYPRTWVHIEVEGVKFSVSNQWMYR